MTIAWLARRFTVNFRATLGMGTNSLKLGDLVALLPGDAWTSMTAATPSTQDIGRVDGSVSGDV